MGSGRNKLQCIYTTPPVITFWVLELITRGGIPWGCGIHRTAGDKVGGRLDLGTLSPRVVYGRGVIAWGVITTVVVSNESCCHLQEKARV